MPQGFNGSCPSMYNFIEPLYCDVSSGPVVLEKKRQTSRATGQMNDPIYAPAFYPLVHYRLWLGSHGAGLEISDPKLKRFFFCFGSSSHYGSWALARFSNTFETWSPRKLFQCIACTQTFNDNIITFSCKSMQFPSKLMLFTYFRPPDQTFFAPNQNVFTTLLTLKLFLTPWSILFLFASHRHRSIEWQRLPAQQQRHKHDDCCVSHVTLCEKKWKKIPTQLLGTKQDHIQNESPKQV